VSSPRAWVSVVRRMGYRLKEVAASTGEIENLEILFFSTRLLRSDLIDLPWKGVEGGGREARPFLREQISLFPFIQLVGSMISG
jgi:hypothetical protein